MMPDLTDPDVKWYLPVTTIVTSVVLVWRRLVGTNYSIKRRKVK